MALGKAFHRLLVKAYVAAVSDRAADITMGNLQRAGSLGNGAGGERRGVDIQQLRPGRAGFEHGIILRQQVRGVLLLRK